MRTTKLISHLSLLLFLLTHSFSVHADPTSLKTTPPSQSIGQPANQYDTANTVYVLTGDHFAPYSSKSMPEQGIVSQIIKEVLAEQFPNKTVEVVIKPWKRAYKSASTPQYLGAFPYSMTKERTQDFLFSDPLIPTKVVFFVRNHSKNPYAKPMDFKGAKICRPLGYHTQDINQWLKPDLAILIQPTNLENCFLMLKSNRVDLVPADYRVGNLLIKESPNLSASNIKPLEKSITENSIHFIISKKRPNAAAEMAKFNNLLNQFKQTEKYQKIIQ